MAGHVAGAPAEAILARTCLPTRAFYARRSEELAKDLLGAVLVHRTNAGLLAGRIVEVEAYLGRGDAAAHSSAGLTRRTRAVFGPPGHAYIYRIYGLHCCLNVVAERDGTPGCVLIRALEPLCGRSDMRSRRKAARRRRDLCSGPGKLTSALAIGMDLYGADLLRGPLTIRLTRRHETVEVATSRRIGISKAAHLPLRFFVDGSEWVSR